MTENPLRAALKKIAELDGYKDVTVGETFYLAIKFARAALATPSDAPEQKPVAHAFIREDPMGSFAFLMADHALPTGNHELYATPQQAAPEQAPAAPLPAALTRASEEVRIDLEGGKYTYVRHADGRQEALRHGEQWRDLVGDKFVYLLTARIEELEAAVTSQQAAPEQASDEWIDKVMEQAQCFASAWAIFGSRFDHGDGQARAGKEKADLRAMLAAAPSPQQAAPEQATSEYSQATSEYLKDAMRWRWIRSHLDDDTDHNLMEHKKGCDYGMKQFASLDAAVDAAIAKECTS